MSPSGTLAHRSVELRTTFDRERAAPAASATEPMENLLGIRVHGDAYAMRVSEIASLAVEKKIAELPGRIPELIGLAAFRGILVPVYSLSLLLGYAAQENRSGWLVLCGPENPIAFAFGDFEGYLQLSKKCVHEANSGGTARTHVTHVVRTEDTVRAVVSIPLLRATMQERCGTNNTKER